YSAPAPCRSGSKGEAPWSLQKERNPHSGNLHTACIAKYKIQTGKSPLAGEQPVSAERSKQSRNKTGSGYCRIPEAVLFYKIVHQGKIK
ncbi:hypothetical protein, partial [Victivallis vadensis]|uniref:hypothetical protein n=2 Tax=Victivallis vadensis TaxID=172901 RepID=UPI00197E238C